MKPANRIRNRPVWIALAGLTGLAACDNDSGTTEPVDRAFHYAALSANPVNVISAEVEVVARGFDAAFVNFWRDGETPTSSPPYAFGGDTVTHVSVLGLRASSDYSIEVMLVAGAAEQAVDTLGFTSGSLPDWLPAPVAVGTDTTPGFLTLPIPDGPAIVDNTGRVVWYRFDPDPTLTNFQAHPDGSYTIYRTQDAVRNYRILDELGRETDSLGCVGWEETRFHEVRIRAGGDAWVMCDDRRVVDLTSVGGLPAVDVNWTVVQHLGPAGGLLFEWKSGDYFDITDVGQDLIVGAEAINATHGNAIAFTSDGNILVSFRTLNEITKIDVATGEIVWRFGGLRNQFTLIGDPKGSFERQHGLRVVEDGVVQFLDNGAFPPSRLVRYRLDEQAMTAELILEFIDSPTTSTPVGGGTEVLQDGYALVSFGRAGRVVETTPTGQRAWELTGTEGLYIFRAQRIPSLYAALRGGGTP